MKICVLFNYSIVYYYKLELKYYDVNKVRKVRKYFLIIFLISLLNTYRWFLQSFLWSVMDL